MSTIHNSDGTVVYTGNNRIVHTLHHQYHRVDGPAIIENFEDTEREEFWYQHGLLHRTDGPAILIYNSNLDIISFAYYYEGVQFYCNTDSEFKQLIKLKAFL